MDISTASPTFSIAKINEFREELDSLLRRVNQVAIPILGKKMDGIEEVLTSKAYLKKLDEEEGKFLLKIHEVVVERARFLQLGKAVGEAEGRGYMCLPQELLNKMLEVHGKYREVAENYWVEEHLEAYENIPEFVEKFNWDFGNRSENRKIALKVLDRLRVNAWKVEDGKRLIPNSREVVSTRNAYYELFQCDDAEIKEIALQYLIDILECDPMSVETAYDLVDLQKKLLEEVQGEKAQNLTTKLQRLLIKAFALSLECILMHNATGNLNALFEDTKNKIWDGASALGDFNVVEDEEIKFWVEYAVQGSQHIKSNVTEMNKWLWRIAILAKAGLIIAATAKDPGLMIDAISTIVSDMKEAFSHVTWRKSWFKHLLILRKLTRYSLLDEKAFSSLIPIFQKIKQEGDSDLVMYGVVSTIEYAIMKSPIKDLQGEGIKLLLQFATYDDPKVQKRVIQALFETLNSHQQLSNTGFVILKILEASRIIKDKQIFQEINNNPEYIRFQIDTSQLYENVIKFLLRRLAEIKGERDYGGHSFVTLLCSSPNAKMIPRLLGALCELSDDFQAPDVYGNTPFHIAAEEGNLPMIKHTHELLSVDINAQGYKNQNTALHLAVMKGNYQSVELLLKCGAKPNIENGEGNTPLHLAVIMGSRKLTELLLHNGASTSRQNNKGQTPLNNAIDQDDVYTVDLLLRNGARIAEHVHQFTPITVAARKESELTLMYLIERKKEELKPLEALEITRMISENGLVISASEEFCRFHLQKLQDDELYQKAFDLYQNLPKIVAQKDGKIGFEGRRKYAIKTSHEKQRDDFGNTALIGLARSTKKIEQFIEKLKEINDVNQSNYFNLTALHAATLFQNYEAVEALLKAHADVYAADIRGFTPLHFASYLKDEKLIRLFLNAGANARTRNDYGDSPLHIVCGDYESRKPETIISLTEKNIPVYQGNVTDIIETLVQSGASPETKDALGNNALHHAAINGNESTIRYLIKGYPDIMWITNKKGLLPIQEAVIVRRHLTIKALLSGQSLKKLHESFVEQTDNRLTLGNQLANTQATDVFEDMIKEMPELTSHADSTPLKSTPIHIAAEQGRVAILEVYIKNKADLNIQDGFGNTAAHLAAINNNVAFLRKLKEGGADVAVKNRDGRTPLHLATSRNHCDVIDFFIQDPATTLQQDGDGGTPLHLACKFKQKEAIKKLCEASPKTVHALDDDMNTPLHHACHAGDWEIVRYLIVEQGAYVEARNIFGETPFIIAALHGYEDTLGYLKLAGANFRAQDVEGESALHKAVFNQHYAIVKQLLPLDKFYPKPPGKALTKLADIRNDTALHELAKVNRKSDKGVPEAIMEELLNAGASVTARNEKGETFLHLVCKNGMDNLFTSYLRRLPPSQQKKLGVFRTTDHRGNTLLHKAVMGNSLQIVQGLIDLKHPLSSRNKSGKSPLLIAVEFRHYGVARTLLKAQAKVNVSDKRGYNILHILLSNEVLTETDLIFLEEAIQLDSSLINSRDANGNTPLHIIAEHGHIQALDLIFKYLDGTDKKNERFIWKMNNLGQTAQEIAEQKGFFELEQKIRNTSKDQLGK